MKRDSGLPYSGKNRYVQNKNDSRRFIQQRQLYLIKSGKAQNQIKLLRYGTSGADGHFS
ncbi:hypothetical protein AAKU55_004694 [Oxalobacteraceae bacterium GrIS 1.11]